MLKHMAIDEKACVFLCGRMGEDVRKREKTEVREKKVASQGG